MARTIDHLAIEHLGNLHRSAVFLGFQVNRAWTEAQHGRPDAATTHALACELYAAAEAIKEAESRLLSAIDAVRQLATR